MQHCLKRSRFWVNVPVLSLNRYPTWPSSSLSEVFRTCAGLSSFSQYISKSQPMNQLCTVWMTSNLQRHRDGQTPLRWTFSLWKGARSWTNVT